MSCYLLDSTDIGQHCTRGVLHQNKRVNQERERQWNPENRKPTYIKVARGIARIRVKWDPQTAVSRPLVSRSIKLKTCLFCHFFHRPHFRFHWFFCIFFLFPISLIFVLVFIISCFLFWIWYHIFSNTEIHRSVGTGGPWAGFLTDMGSRVAFLSSHAPPVGFGLNWDDKSPCSGWDPRLL